MTEPTRTLVTGATGTLGAELVSQLREAGHEVRAASRSPPAATDADSAGGEAAVSEWIEFDLVDGTGIRSAVTDVDVVVHAATAPRGDTEAVDVRGTERLLDAAADAGVANFVYVSIVGVDEIPLTYYEHKREAEESVKNHDAPSTIVRATQFHPFVRDLLESIARLPVWPLPTRFHLQPIAVGEAAAAIVDLVSGEPAGRVPTVGGPEALSVGDLARAYRDARGLRRPIVRLPIPGSAAAGFRSGAATRPERTVGTVTWEEWLAGERAAARPLGSQ